MDFMKATFTVGFQSRLDSRARHINKLRGRVSRTPEPASHSSLNSWQSVSLNSEFGADASQPKLLPRRIGALHAGRRKEMLAQALEGLLQLFRSRVLSFDSEAARRFADLAVAARAAGRGFPTSDVYIAAIAETRGFIVASRDTAPYEAAGLKVLNHWMRP